MKNVNLFVMLLIGMAGCVQDPSSVRPVVPVPSARGLYVANQGFYGQSNASLTYYDLESFTSYDDVFKSVNGRNLGDVANQVVLRGERGYVVINNSDRIEIFSTTDVRSLGSVALPTGSSPCEMAMVDDSVGLVTNLYDNSVSVLDLKRAQVIRRIPVGNNPEGIAIAGGKAVVANSGFGVGTTASIITVGQWTGSRTVHVGDNPQEVVAGADGSVYVLCTGSYGDFSDPNDDTPSSIFIIDPVSETVRDSIRIGPHASTIALGPEGLAYVPTTDSVVTVDLLRRKVTGAFRKGAYFGVAVEQVSGDVYLTDVRNYSGPGRVLVFSPAGEYRTEFPAGLIPGSMAFKR
jgi:YVTN family beta-propeller protein